MIKQENLRVIFTSKAESLFADFLKNNGLEETDEEFDKYLFQEQESRAMIVRDAVETMARRIVPEKKLIELLQKHLEIPKDTIEKIVKDIKEKILPLLLIYPDKKFSDYNFREKVSEEIFGNEDNLSGVNNTTKELIERIKAHDNTPVTVEENKSPGSYPKKAPITDVEKNAENMEDKEKNIITGQGNKLIKKTNENKNPETPAIQQDTYREPIE